MNISKLTILLSLFILAAYTHLSCDDKEKAKFQENLRADLLQKMNSNIDEYPELNGITVVSIEPFQENQIVKEGDIYTAKTTATLSYVSHSSQAILPTLKQIEQTIDVTVSGTKEDFLSGHYTWKADSDRYEYVSDITAVTSCQIALETESIYNEIEYICHQINDKFGFKTDSYNRNAFVDKCYTLFGLTYYDRCIDYTKTKYLNTFDESNYRFYELCSLLKSENHYADLIDNLYDRVEEIKHLVNQQNKLYSDVDLKSFQPQNFDTNCRNLCQNLSSKVNNFPENFVEQCISICSSSCDQFCGKVHTNYLGADDAFLTVFAFFDYLNPESSHTADQIAQAILKDYGTDTAIYFGSNPKDFHPYNTNQAALYINEIEEYAHLNSFGMDVHNFLIKYSPLLDSMDLYKSGVYDNDFPIYSSNMAHYNFYPSHIKNLQLIDEVNYADLQTIANSLGIRGKGSVLAINDMIIPIEPTTTYDSIKPILETELNKARAISKQTGLKGIPLANHIRSKAIKAAPKNSKIEFSINNRDEPPVFIETGESPVIGNNDAPVTIVVFSNYECNHCQTGNQTLMDLYHKYTQDIRIVYKHSPFPHYKYSFIAARAAIAAQAQNSFESYSEKLYEITLDAHHSDIDEDDFTQSTIDIAVELGLNKNKFIQVMNSTDTKKRVEQEYELFRTTLHLKAVPSYYINGDIVRGEQSFDMLETLFLLIRDQALHFKSNAKGEALYKAIVMNPSEDKFVIDTSKDIHIGSPDATTTIVHFLNIQDGLYNLPSYYHTKLYINHSSNKYRVIYKPIAHDFTSKFYARVLIAASKQNFFLEMADYLVHRLSSQNSNRSNSDDIFLNNTLNDILQFVSDSGRDKQTFLLDFQSEDTNQIIEQNIADYNLLKCSDKASCYIVQNKVVRSDDELDVALKANYDKSKNNHRQTGN